MSKGDRNKAKQPRPGRPLEELVAKLERIVHLPEFADQDLEVKSPAFWKDPETGELREVDVSVGPRGATPSGCIMVECRDRSKRQDVMWLEQIEGKRRSLQPMRVIAVSKRGFTKPAVMKARAWGIELRAFEDLSPDLVRSWLNPDMRPSMMNRCSVVDELSIDLVKEGSRLLELGTPEADDRVRMPTESVTFIDDTGREYQTRELVYLLGDERLDALSSTLRAGRGSKTWNIRLHVPSDHPVVVRTPIGDLPVQQIRFKLSLWLEECESQLSAMTSYVGRDEEVMQMVTYTHESAHSPAKFTIARASTPNEDGSHNLYLMFDRQPGPSRVTPPPADEDDE